MKCPICSSETRRLFQKNGYWIRRCEACSHLIAEIDPSPDHVAVVYGDEYFSGGKDGYPNYLSEARILTASGERYAAQLNRFMNPGSMLDIGSAAGFIAKGFQNSGWRVRGIEPNDRMAKLARQHGIDVLTGTLEGFRSEERFDLITMIQVLPHLYDLQNALAAAEMVTKPGGFWLIETWDRESFVARVLGQRWHEYSPPSVLHYFSKKGLVQLALGYGFNRVAQGRPAKRLSGQHAKSVLKNNFREGALGWLVSAGLRLIPDRLILPYPAFDVFWVLFRKVPSEHPFQ